MRGSGWRWMVGMVAVGGIAVSHAMAEDKPEALVGWAKQAAAEGPSIQVGDAFMVPYTYTIPGTDIACEMIPVPGGTVKMGSPDSEAGRAADEGPLVEVEVAPFWMAKVEVRWAEYRQFMRLYKIFKALQSQKIRRVTDDNRVDAITVPTPLYEPDHTFEFGDDPDQPAVTMTQYAAKQYSKWLSGMTGQQLRLPTAAEWEHAARAGTQTPYSFGDAADQLDQYAYHAGNSPDGPGKVGTKMPNPWGLHDMHGNVWEWVIDGYSPEGYTALAATGRW
ncbi:MAG: formylglycine-generating enzyme family protein [Pirellulaceae bacterium]